MSASKVAAAVPRLQVPGPTSGYRWRVWLAVASLLGFLGLYLGLAAWFGFTAWRLAEAVMAGHPEGFWAGLVALCAALLALFMLKALFFRQHRNDPQAVLLDPAEQPALFAELHAIADAVGAPRPHKVYLTPRVNAAVFYDLSPLNLLWPTRKNLEIGLGLVNVLDRSEFRAVLAHEFGHFAQRAMAVGRWVYVAQQIAGRVVAKRDMLDDFLRALSRFDFRVAWVGWILSLIVWAIRSLVDTVFTGVSLLQRELGREMEYGADAVAVALTGSDALVHALYKLPSADADWDRAAALAGAWRAQGQWPRDFFAVQSAVAARVAHMLDDPHYGRVPPVSAEAAAERRLFSEARSNVPKMWLTHPLNHEREARAKQPYLPGDADTRSAWTLFANSPALRDEVTRRLLETPHDAALMDDAAVQAAVDEPFAGPHLQAQFRGVYLGRPLTRHVATADELAVPMRALSLAQGVQRLAALYPASLGEAVRRWRELDPERHAAELQALAQQLREHDRRARSLHLGLAHSLADGSEARLQGLLAQLHYAEHTAADILDQRGFLAHTVRICTTGRVGDGERRQILLTAAGYHQALLRVYQQAEQVVLDAATMGRLEISSWAEGLGRLGLEPPRAENLGDWLNVVDSWADQADRALDRLRGAVLAELLACEAEVAERARQAVASGAQPVAPEVAPTVPQAPTSYATLLEGAERPRDLKPSLWARFLAASGPWATAARLGVAGSIVAGVLGFGGGFGQVGLVVYNGFSQPVRVQFGEAKAVEVPALASLSLQHAPQRHMAVRTTTLTGQLIEQFDTPLEQVAGHAVYNIAGGAPLVELTFTYGPGGESPPPTPRGAARWSVSRADVLFGDPPQSVSLKHGQSARRTVLYGAADMVPALQRSFVSDAQDLERLAAAHLRWDAQTDPLRTQWVAMLRDLPAHERLLTQALARTPADIELQRERIDSLPAERALQWCGELQQAAARQPQDADAAYLAARCLPEGAERDAALRAAHAKFPQHAWLNLGLGWTEAGHARWAEAERAFEVARAGQGVLAPFAALELLRVRRMQGQGGGDEAALKVHVARPSRLQAALGMHEVAGTLLPDLTAYQRLAAGAVNEAAKQAGGGDVRLQRLASASDGADVALVRRAQQLPAPRGFDLDSVWATRALAVREGWPEVEAPKAADRDAVRVEAFWGRLQPLRRQPNLPPNQAQALDQLLDGATPTARGQAYAMAAILLGGRTPPEWREGAKRLLLPTERPYFR